jgi:hypothetical protein
MINIHDVFTEIIDPRWQLTEQGNGGVIRRQGAVHLTLPPSDDSTYHNAQMTDYKPTDKNFSFAPPLRLTIRAYSSLHPNNMKGTAGFGFWNHALAPDQKGFGLPQTVWFFFSAKPSNITLARGINGNGLKTATFNAKRWQARLLLPLAPLGIALMRVPSLYNALWGTGQRAIGVSEASLDADLLTAEHTYTIEWRTDGATFLVDGEIVHHAKNTPKNALGFIAWMDNQYAIVSPQGDFRMGLTSIDKGQALVLRSIQIDSL